MSNFNERVPKKSLKTLCQGTENDCDGAIDDRNLGAVGKVHSRIWKRLGWLPFLIFLFGAFAHAALFLVSPISSEYSFHSWLAGRLAAYLFTGCLLLWLAITVSCLINRRLDDLEMVMLMFLKGILLLPVGLCYLVFFFLICIITTPTARDTEEFALNVASHFLEVELPSNSKIIDIEVDGWDGLKWLVLELPESDIVAFSARLEESPRWTQMPFPAHLISHWDYYRRSEEFDFLKGVDGYFCFVDLRETLGEPIHNGWRVEFALGVIDLRSGRLYFRIVRT